MSLLAGLGFGTAASALFFAVLDREKPDELKRHLAGIAIGLSCLGITLWQLSSDEEAQ